VAKKTADQLDLQALHRVRECESATGQQLENKKQPHDTGEARAPNS
jgi:hypothetical protein